MEGAARYFSGINKAQGIHKARKKWYNNTVNG